jgi:putative SOS response-associated peptidase YedK
MLRSAILLLMCGRYRLSRSKELLAEHLDVEPDDDDWSPRHNITPTQNIPVIRQHPEQPKRLGSRMRWGLIPFWAKDPSIGFKMINARAETVATKPAFRESLSKRRCLIPADGFFEWRKNGKVKTPFCFTMADDSIFAFAGIWDSWRNPEGQTIKTCSIITTTPNALLADIHDRMPAILPTDAYDLWLDPGFQKPDAICDLLRPFEPTLMRRYEVSSRVNLVKNDDAGCAEPVVRLSAANAMAATD